MAVYFKDGKFVNENGFETDANGTVIQAKLPPSDLAVTQQLLADANARVTLLQTQGMDIGDPESQDSRTVAQLQAALTAGAIAFDPKYDRASLQALAKEHNL